MEQSNNTTQIFAHDLRIADLPHSRAHEFTLEPDVNARSAIAEHLDIRAVKKLRLNGTLAPAGKSDWQLSARLGATVVQDCVITLEPVTTRIDEDVLRKYIADLPDQTGEEEAEIPEDDTIDPLPAVLHLGAVMIEALALALPEYPQIEGADSALRTYTEPGKPEMSDEDTKPFAGLASLRNKISGADDNG